MFANIDANGYLGWRNRQTWLVALWVQNTERYYKKAMACENAEELEECVASLLPRDGFAGDLIGDALGRVDFDRIYEVMHEGEVK